ncbi:MAG: UPF0182 family protein, partial [Propioniciclava sp.]
MTAVIIAVAIAAFFVFAAVWTEKLWFDSTGFSGVFTTQLVAHVVLFVLAALVVGGLIGTNMWVALRLRPRQRTRGSSQVLDRYRDLLENNRVAAVIIPSAVFGVMAGMSMSTQVMPVLAWLNRKPSGIVDPYFGLDTTFYMIDYPVLRLVLSLLMSGLAFGLVAAAAVHFAVGNIVISRERRGVGAPRVARVHLSIVAAVILLVFGLQCLVDRFGLLLQQGSLFTGLQYTDGNARMTAQLVLAVISFIVAALFVVNAFVNRTILPVVGVVLMLVTSLILSMIYPAVVQTFQVRPNEPDRENDYIQAHLTATKQAYGLTD